MKKSACVFMLVICSLLLLSGCSNGEKAAQTAVEPDKNGYISYVRTEDMSWIDGVAPKTYVSKLFIMSPKGEDIIMLDKSLKNGIAHAWSNDGRMLAVSTFQDMNRIAIHDMENPPFYREQVFNRSERFNETSQIKLVIPGYNDYSIQFMIWWEDQKGLDALMVKEGDYLFCSIQLPDGWGGKPDSEAVKCQDFKGMVGNVPFNWVRTFKRNSTDQRKLVSFENINEKNEYYYDTYLFDSAALEMELLVHGNGSDISPDGKKILVSNMPGKEDCLVEYNIEEKVAQDLYCSEPTTSYSYAYSLTAFSNAVYSPDGKTIMFAASRDYYEIFKFGVYKMDLSTHQIELVTVWGDGNAKKPLWQPYCEACKKRTAEGTVTP